MTYDDVKSFGSRRYTGMRVGGHHDWDYPDGRWQETKVSPGQWDFTFRSTKRRRRPAPEGSGAEAGTMFHWFVLAHQRVRKVDANTYETFMEGAKHKVGHRKPSWRRWSSESPASTAARDRVAEILEETLRGLRGAPPVVPPRLETALDPDVLPRASRSLDEFLDE